VLLRRLQRNRSTATIVFVARVYSSAIAVIEGRVEEVEILRDALRAWGDWTLSRNGLYYATIRDGFRREEFVIRYRDLGSGQINELYKKDGAFYHIWLAVSPSEEWILFREGPYPTAELTLVENRR
jgi:hypothetical protein